MPGSPSYNVVQGEVKVEGSAAFHFANPGFVDHGVILDSPVPVRAGDRLFFESRLRYATSSQVATVQASVGGGSWTTLWSRAGTSSSGQAAFEIVSLSLVSYVGLSPQFRFLYDFTGGSAYTGTSSLEGWFVDDIQVGSAFIPRLFSGVGDPTAEEVLMVEFVNRARADAAAEAQRLRNTTDPDVTWPIFAFGVDLDLMEAQFALLPPSLPPLAISERLTASARLHSQDMLNQMFQGHSSSSSPPPPNQPGDGVGERVQRQGYAYQNVAENIFAYAESPWQAHAAFNIDWGGGPGGMQTPASHRLALHSATYREIGVGILFGTNGSVGPMLVTQDLGREQGGDRPFLVGVAHLDPDGDGFYDPGQGLGQVQVSVEGWSFYTLTSPQGAYALPLPTQDGTYTVRFEAAGYLSASFSISVTAGANVKLDYVPQADPGPPPSLGDPAMTLSGGQLAFRVSYAGDPARLALEFTEDFDDWDLVPSMVESLGGLEYRLVPTAQSADRGAYRVVLVPAP